MKKRVCFILALLFMACICLCGCSADEQEKTELPQIKYENFHNMKNSFAVSDEDFIYVGNHHCIYKAPLGTTDFKCIYSDENLYINKIALGSDRIYFSSVEKLYSADKEGGSLKTVEDMGIPMEKILWETFYIFEDRIYLKNGNRTAVLHPDGSTAEDTTASDRVYLNSRGMEYEFNRQSDKGNGTIHIKQNGSVIPAEGTVINDSSFVFTDDYIFYLTGKETDFSCNITLNRCLPDGSRQQKIADFDKSVNLYGWDSENVYFHNYEEFFILNQDSGRITQTAVSCRQGNVYEVCDGKLFRVYSLEPWTAEFSTGEKIPLIDKV